MDTGRQWLCRLVSFWDPGERIWRFSLFSLVCILCLSRRPVHCVFEWLCQLELKCECLNGLQDENNGLYSPFKMEKSLTSSPIALTVCLAYTAQSYSYPIQSLPVSWYFLFSCYIPAVWRSNVLCVLNRPGCHLSLYPAWPLYSKATIRWLPFRT